MVSQQSQQFLHDVEQLDYWCNELVRRLQECRDRLSDEEFDKAHDGPFAEVLCAAMDVEDAYAKM